MKEAEHAVGSAIPAAQNPPSFEVPTTRLWYTVALLTIAYSLSILDRTILSLMVGPLQKDLHISDMQVGLLQGFVFAIFFAIAGLPIGWLIDRTSRRGVIGTGIALWSAMTIISGVATSYLQLFAARIGVGVGEAALGPGSYSLLADLVPKHRLARAVAVFHTGSMIGVGVAFAFGGALISALSQRPAIVIPVIGPMRVWQVGFLVAGAPGLLLAILMLTVPEPIRPVQHSRHVDSLKGLRAFLVTRRKVLFFHWTAFCFLAMNNYAFITWVPTMLIRHQGTTPAAAGAAMGIAAGVFGLLGTLAGGSVADRWLREGRNDSSMRVGLVGALGVLPCSLGVALSGITAVKVLCLFGLFFSLCFPGGAGYAGLQLITPPRLRGQVSALFLLMVSIVGIGIGPVVVAFFTDYVYRDRSAVGLSLASVAITAIPCAITAFALGMKPFARAMSAP